MDHDILVLGFGVSCLSVYAYLDKELTKQVGRVVLRGKLEEMSDREIENAVISRLQLYAGKTEMVVIYEPYVAVLLRERLTAEFPKQKFVYPGLELIEAPGDSFMMTLRLRRLFGYQKIKAECEDFCERKWRNRDGNSAEIKEGALKSIKAVLADQDRVTV